ncbi:FAD-dependent oxidoreductase [Pacificimonas flava]|uniref:FAD-dependent oxidoreductase n=2 Tax=Pacificimonas TaxID=1960290 RepID=A0A219B8A7_9SPHN|nr:MULTISPECIES: FAD-dependent oxidoreductase [Pacificimonas]MBZ6379821.1 FAD-dependent oxidoreductase [Pacificimonas aurantium]OWV34356.1 FAD-dependent oxidoreductase [Pacificimonas flava]
MKEEVLVVGAGIGGLCAALSLSPTGRAITLLERDPAPPGGDADEIFEDWRRMGASHVRQSHAFLARLRGIIKANHPDLLAELRDMGVRELSLDSMLTEQQQETYRPQAGDEDLTIITSRRTTLELVMRRYVERMENVTIRSGFRVTELIHARQPDGVMVVSGVRGTEDGEEVSLSADVIVDASGKNGPLLPQLMKDGARVKEESETAGILYFTRHYRLNPGQDEPSRTENPPASGDLGFLKFGVFPGDNGCFSITLAVPEVEHELRRAVTDPECFHAITHLLPGLKPWTDERRSTGRGKVYGMGDLHSRWRELLPGGEAVMRGYFALGDTLVRTNPLYGRGCSFAAVSGEALREALDTSPDPEVRQKIYYRRLRSELRPYYDNQLSQDRSAIRRARNALTPGYRKGLRARMLESFFDDGVRIALRSDTDLLRQAMRGFHMLEHPNKWLGKPANFGKVMYYWTRGKRRNAAAYPPKLGPDRADMLERLSIDHRADMISQGSRSAGERQAAG